jgi:hypothetical protein
VCYYTYEEEGGRRPRAFPCLHTYCTSCCEGVLRTTRACPLCSQPLPPTVAEVEQLPRNWALIQVGGAWTCANGGPLLHNRLRPSSVRCFFQLMQEAGPEAEVEVLPAEAEATTADPYLAPGVMVEDLVRRLQALVSEARAQLQAPAAAAAQAETSADEGPLPAQPQPPRQVVQLGR